MIWEDPWIDNPTAQAPPEPPALPAGLAFRCVRVDDIEQLLLRWSLLVGTQWPAPALRKRLTGAWVALLIIAESNDPVATCVLRPVCGWTWALETFVVAAEMRGAGIGRLLLRHAVPWAWAQGCRSLVYTWELTLGALLTAWRRGWLRTAVAYEWGWTLRSSGSSGCNFCPAAAAFAAQTAAEPLLFRDRGGTYAVVSDSGLRDGWGYVMLTGGGDSSDPKFWNAVMQKGGWRALWYRGSSAPGSGSGWRWSGEVVVVGVIGATPEGLNAQLRLSPEIASR